MDINELKNKFQELMEKVSDKKTLADLELKFLGRRGEINDLLKKIKDLAAEEKIAGGKLINDLKKEIEQKIIIKKKDLLVAGQDLIKRIDVTAPGSRVVSGHLHPRTQVLRKIEEIFISLGFSVIEGPEVETQWYNFEALNIPKDHPARDMQDTFYVKNPAGQEDLVLRTHTSPNQVRFMEKNNPPLRII
ncbi:MAG: Phenylalanine-tRNA ligase alpha subunit, partial [Parcubacteria group bacterium GW2011_GWC2_42_6]